MNSTMWWLKEFVRDLKTKFSVSKITHGYQYEMYDCMLCEIKDMSERALCCRQDRKVHLCSYK